MAALNPSHAARRVACPGSRQLELLYPQLEKSESAREGIAAHWVVQRLFERYHPLHLNIGAEGEVSVGDQAPNGEYVTQEMIDAAELVWDEVTDVAELTEDDYGGATEANLKNPNVYKLMIEKPLEIFNIHPLCRGTPDYWFYRPGHLYLWDFKYGHSPVDPFENWQLIEYAAGILHLLKQNGYYDQLTQVTFCIIQPRSFGPGGPVQKWQTTAEELRGYFNQLEAAEYASMQPDAKCTPSPECNRCDARHACPALNRAALTAIDVSMSAVPYDLPTSQLGALLRLIQNAAKRLDALKTGLEEQALAELKSGKRVPFFALAQSVRRECWNKPAEEIDTLGKIYGQDLKKPMQMITPKQAIAKGLPEDVVQQYTTRPPGEMKLVPEDLKLIKKLFGGSNE